MEAINYKMKKLNRFVYSSKGYQLSINIIKSAHLFFNKKPIKPVIF